MPRRQKRSGKRARRKTPGKAPKRRKAASRSRRQRPAPRKPQAAPKPRKPPPVVLRPGDEPALQAALARVPARVLAKSLGVSAKELRRWAEKGIPAGRKEAREFRELLKMRAEVVRIQQTKKRAEALVTRVGAAKVGETLKVDAATVRRWIASGNADRANEILVGYERGKAALKNARERQKRGRSDEKTFRALVKASGEIAEIPVVKTFEGPRQGRHTQGYTWTRAFRQEVTRGFLDDVVSWAESLPKKFPLFQLVARVSELALSPAVALDRPRTQGGARTYPTVLIHLPHAKTGDFAIDALVTSGAHTIKARAIADLVNKLYDLLSGGRVKVFVHAVIMQNYRRRNDEERRSYARHEAAKRDRLKKKKGSR